MATFATELGSNANGIESLTPSAAMCRVVGEAIGRANVDPPARFADPQSRFILVEHASFHQSRVRRWVSTSANC